MLISRFGTDDRVKLPSDSSRMVKGVDVLPWVLSPLMGPEEYDEEVSAFVLALDVFLKRYSDTRPDRTWIYYRLPCNSYLQLSKERKTQFCE